MTPGGNKAEQRICAVRLPGTSRARFVDAGDVEATLGDWIVIDSGSGEEAGQIVVAPDQWIEPVQMDDVPVAIRQVTDDELDTIAANINRALSLISPAADLLRGKADGVFLCGLRLTLAGDAVIAAYAGNAPDDAETLTRQLAEILGMPVHLEQESAGDPERDLLSGSTGLPRRDRPETFRELLARRMDVLRDPDSFAPQGMPRLGATVSTPQGTGRLVAVEIRRWKATVSLESGEEITLSVDDLAEP
jgi:cell fate regulator YaaT (PSP1 superfamily)